MNFPVFQPENCQSTSWCNMPNLFIFLQAPAIVVHTDPTDFLSNLPEVVLVDSKSDGHGKQTRSLYN